MDPVTGIGLAASVVQLVQFSINAAKTCQQIYQEGSTNEHLDAGFTTTQLANLTSSLQQSLAKHHTLPSSLSREEKQLFDVAHRCEGSANKLQHELRKLQTLPQASALAAVRKAARSILKKNSIVKIQEQLEGYRTVLETSLLYQLSERFNVQSLRNSQRFANLDETLKDIVLRLADSQTSLATLVQRESEHLCQQFAAQAANERLLKDVTRSLFFADITSRQAQVANEFDGIDNSYEWVFSEPSESASNSDDQSQETQKEPHWDNFSEWLRAGNSVYWINGKAGSGKSTLMNYICNHKKKEEYLKQWSADKRLLTPTFFFWNAGACQQKSIDGLFRSLIYQMLRECPSLITYFENESLHTWTEKRLLDIFVVLLTQTEIPLMICLFIDGLDEFEGRYDALVGKMNLLANKINIKICVSSRPLLIFEKTFAGKPSLRLQDLTFDSIRTYADKQLSPLIESRMLNSRDDGKLAKHLLNEIVWRAEGVFLWAVTAIRDVRDGLNDFVDLHELARVIEDLPSEIESLYMQMLNRIKPAYRRGAARILQVLLYQSQNLLGHYRLDLFRLYFVEEQRVSEDLPLVYDRFDDKDIARDCHALKSRLISHTGGLLDIAPIGRTDEMCVKCHYDEVLCSKILFSHRTVKDFLLHNSAARAFIAAAGVVEEHLRISIARGTLAHLARTLHEGCDHIYYEYELHDSFHTAMTQISIVERLTEAVQSNLMRSLHASSYMLEAFVKALDGALDGACSEPYIIDGPFKSTVDLIGMAARCGMFRYICHMLDLSVDEPQRHHAILSGLRQKYSADQVIVASLAWNTSSECGLDYSDYRQKLGQSLEWKLHPRAAVQKDAHVGGSTLAETYLLACCFPSVADHNLADILTLVRTLLRAGANPMVRVEPTTESSLMNYFPESSDCFWSNWLVFLRWFTRGHLAGDAGRKFGGGSNLSDCVDSRVTLDNILNTTEALLAQGADINYQVDFILESRWGCSLRRCDLQDEELDFEVTSSAMFWLEECFGGYQEFRDFATAVQPPVKRPWRKIVSIFYNTGAPIKRGDPDDRPRPSPNPDDRLRAYPNEEEQEILWPLIERWEESGQWRDLDALRSVMRRVFRAHKPDIKLNEESVEE